MAILQAEAKVLSTVARGPDGHQGFVEQAFRPTERVLELRYHCVDGLPDKIDNYGRESIEPGKGLPTVVYFSLKQLPRLGVAQGGLREIVAPMVRDPLSLCQLHRLRRKHPGQPLTELARHTRTALWIDAIARLSGHQQRGVLDVDDSRAVKREIGDLLEHLERLAPDHAAARARHDAMLTRFGYQRYDVMLMDYDLRLRLGGLRVSVTVKTPPPRRAPEPAGVIIERTAEPVMHIELADDTEALLGPEIEISFTDP